MKQALLEFSAPKCKILEEVVDENSKERVMRVEVKWQHAGIINGNRRRYSKEILAREIARLTPMIEAGSVMGASYHPQNDAEVDDVSHIWESVKMAEDGECTGVVKVLPTERGRNAQAIIKYGGHIGMSSRGFGTTTRKEEVVDGKKVMIDEINPDFQLKSPGDFVLTPSVPDAGVRRMLESRLNDGMDSEDSKGDTMSYRTLEDLRTAQPELVKPLDDEINSLKEEVKGLKEQLTTALDEITSLKEKVTSFEKDVQVVSEGIRNAISVLGKLPGVFEEEEPAGTSDPGTPATAPVVAPPVADPNKLVPDAEKEALKVEIATLKAEKEAKAQAEAQAANEKAVTEALKGILEKEIPEYKKLIEAELIKDGKCLIEKVEDVAAKVTSTKEAISTRIAEEEKSKIRATGTDDKGHITDPEGKSKRLTEEEVKSRWEAALKAGYKGTLEKYSRDVLKLK